ncbi:MAG: methyl-accepting chemotaxis protein, partial [Deltaproteobacteria bacterium]|nr:methyl-accepting chemotaxis protein [Deltaproteobacteria bacterium]
MFKFRLRTKLILISMATLIIPMIVSICVTAYIITQQNQGASFDQITKSVDIIRDDLQSKQQKQKLDAAQMASMNGMGSRMKVLFENKANPAMASVIMENVSRDISKDIFQLGRTSNLQRAEIYDLDGDLVSFAVLQDNGAYIVGYPSPADKTSINYADVKEGGELTDAAWAQSRDLKNFQINLKFGKEIPKENMSGFEPSHGFLAMVVCAPIEGNVFKKQTGKLEKMQLGFSMAVRRIDKPFVEKMSTLTGMKVNLFLKDGLSVGSLPDYKQLAVVAIKEKNDSWDLAKQGVLLSDVDLQDKPYFQGVLPFYDKSGLVGSLAVLFSKETAKANTSQMIKLLIIVYGGCILLFVPLSLIFANALAKPIKKCVNWAKNIGEGDFSQRIDTDSRDEVGELMQAFNKMTDSLREKTALASAIASGDLTLEASLSSNKDTLGQVLAKMIFWLNDILSQINETVTQTASEANQVSDSSQLLSQGATEQAASLEEISASMTQLATQTKSNADNASQANKLALTARTAAENGNEQ